MITQFKFVENEKLREGLSCIEYFSDNSTVCRVHLKAKLHW